MQLSPGLLLKYVILRESFPELLPLYMSGQCQVVHWQYAALFFSSFSRLFILQDECAEAHSILCKFLVYLFHSSTRTASCYSQNDDNSTAMI